MSCSPEKSSSKNIQKPIWVYFWGVGKPGDGKRGELHQTDGLVTGIALEKLILIGYPFRMGAQQAEQITAI
jgi:hypothetical protein